MAYISQLDVTQFTCLAHYHLKDVKLNVQDKIFFSLFAMLSYDLEELSHVSHSYVRIDRRSKLSHSVTIVTVAGRAAPPAPAVVSAALAPPSEGPMSRPW